MIGGFRFITIILATQIVVGCLDNSDIFVSMLQECVPIEQSNVSFADNKRGYFYTTDHRRFSLDISTFKHKQDEWSYGIIKESCVLNEEKWLFERRGIGVGALIDDMRKSIGDNGGIAYYKDNGLDYDETTDGYLPRRDGNAVVYSSKTKIIYHIRWQIMQL